MRFSYVSVALPALACAAFAAPAPAGWFVRAPYVTVSGGPGGVSVQAPFVDVRVGAAPGKVMAPVPPPPPTVVAVPTLEEFAATFRPAPGTYEVTFLHTRSCCPVTVCFTLPPGCPKVCVHKHQLDFEYPCEDVRIRCQIFGKVKVSYR
jgi:hypothetical protein